MQEKHAKNKIRTSREKLKRIIAEELEKAMKEQNINKIQETRVPGLTQKIEQHAENMWSKKGAAWVPLHGQWEYQAPWGMEGTADQLNRELKPEEQKMLQAIANSFEPGKEQFDDKITSVHMEFAETYGSDRLQEELIIIEEKLKTEYPHNEEYIKSYIDSVEEKIEVSFLNLKQFLYDKGVINPDTGIQGKKIIGLYADKILKGGDASG